jgi:poly(beta-D-mannuronate) lyase
MLVTRSLPWLALSAALAMIAVAPASACPFPPAAIRDLHLARFYTDAAGSKADPGLTVQHTEETAPVRDYLRTVVSETDASFLQETDSLGSYRAKCALEWLEVWARGGALLGTLDTKQAAAERRWTLAGAALAYLKVKPSATPGQAAIIEAWLKSMAAVSQAEFAQSKSKHNNHWYWLGLGIGATALATGDDTMWPTARAIMQDATAAIAANGTLPLELARQARALHYHAFALMPLTALAELARSRGEDWYAFNNGALQRLVDVTVDGLLSPGTFKRFSGFDQEEPVDRQYGWLPLYRLQRPGAFPQTALEMPAGHAWLGGNVLLLNRRLAARAACQPGTCDTGR